MSNNYCEYAEKTPIRALEVKKDKAIQDLIQIQKTLDTLNQMYENWDFPTVDVPTRYKVTTWTSCETIIMYIPWNPAERENILKSFFERNWQTYRDNPREPDELEWTTYLKHENYDLNVRIAMVADWKPTENPDINSCIVNKISSKMLTIESSIYDVVCNEDG